MCFFLFFSSWDDYQFGLFFGVQIWEFRGTSSFGEQPGFVPQPVLPSSLGAWLYMWIPSTQLWPRRIMMTLWAAMLASHVTWQVSLRSYVMQAIEHIWWENGMPVWQPLSIHLKVEDMKVGMATTNMPMTIGTRALSSLPRVKWMLAWTAWKISVCTTAPIVGLCEMPSVYQQLVRWMKNLIRDATRNTCLKSVSWTSSRLTMWTAPCSSSIPSIWSTLRCKSPKLGWRRLMTWWRRLVESLLMIRSWLVLHYFFAAYFFPFFKPLFGIILVNHLDKQLFRSVVERCSHLQRNRRLYAAMTLYMDAAIGEAVEALKKKESCGWTCHFFFGWPTLNIASFQSIQCFCIMNTENRVTHLQRSMMYIWSTRSHNVTWHNSYVKCTW